MTCSGVKVLCTYCGMCSINNLVIHCSCLFLVPFQRYNDTLIENWEFLYPVCIERIRLFWIYARSLHCNATFADVFFSLIAKIFNWNGHKQGKFRSHFVSLVNNHSSSHSVRVYRVGLRTVPVCCCDH